MGGGNGAKAAMKRDKNAAAGNKAGSQLKTNIASQSIQCKTCFQTFQSTAKVPELTQHAENKHSKTIADCFPTFGK